MRRCKCRVGERRGIPACRNYGRFERYCVTCKRLCQKTNRWAQAWKEQ